MPGGCVLLDFSGVYRMMRTPPGTLVDCRGIEGTSCYCDAEAAEEIARRIASLPLHAVHFLDSGDYHYLTRLWTARIGRPYALVLLDNHPDMQAPVFPGVMSCGGWVRDILVGDPFCRKVLVVGTDPALAGEAGETDGHVLLLDRRLPAGVQRREAEAFLSDGLPLYLSIDKDVLSSRWAATDWSQGEMDLDGLCRFLRCVGEGRAVIGADVCGELPLGKGGSPQAWECNAVANEKLLAILDEILRNSDDFIVSLFSVDNE